MKLFQIQSKKTIAAITAFTVITASVGGLVYSQRSQATIRDILGKGASSIVDVVVKYTVDYFPNQLVIGAAGGAFITYLVMPRPIATTGMIDQFSRTVLGAAAESQGMKLLPETVDLGGPGDMKRWAAAITSGRLLLSYPVQVHTLRFQARSGNLLGQGKVLLYMAQPDEKSTVEPCDSSGDVMTRMVLTHPFTGKKIVLLAASMENLGVAKDIAKAALVRGSCSKASDLNLQIVEAKGKSARNRE